MKKILTTPGVKGVFISAIFFLIIVVLFWRPVLVLYHQQQAGRIIDQAAINIKGSDLVSYRCFLGQLDETSSPELDKAINHLTKASKLQEQNAYNAYLLGQAYCLNQAFDQATTIFEKAQDLKENNPNLYIETGFAYQARAYDAWKNQDDVLIIEMIAKAYHNLQRGQINFDNLSSSANVFFVKGEFLGAYFLYWLAKEYQPLSAIQDFRIFLINKILNREFPLLVSNFDTPVLNFDIDLIISPNEMFSLNEARKVSQQEIDESIFGVVWSNKSDVVTLVDFSETGNYVIEIQLLDHSPAPTRLQMSVDFEPVLIIELPDGDDQIKTFEVETTVSEGVHLLNIKLLNDAFVNGEDRNGYVYQVLISKK